MSAAYSFDQSLVVTVADESRDLTPEELAVLSVVKDENDKVEEPHRLSEDALVRFVRGYAFEKHWLEECVKQVKDTLQWRVSEPVRAGTLLSRDLPGLAEFSKAWPSQVCGVDAQGHPIIVESLGDIDIDSLLKLSNEQLTTHQARNLENVEIVKAAVGKALGRRIYKHCYVLDIGGLSTKHYKIKDNIKAIFHVAQYYYPETLHKMFLINSPLLFRAVWKMVSPMIHPITKEKIKVVGDSYLKDLAANGIAASQIPPSIRGSWKRE